jgi:transposase
MNAALPGADGRELGRDFRTCSKEHLTSAPKMTVDAVAEILTQPERRRHWTSDQKLALVVESLRPGASPTQVARRYGISTGLLYTWRHLARSGELAMVPATAQFVPVEIVSEAPPEGTVRPALW